MTNIAAFTSAAVTFLRRWQPSGPWVLSALDPDHGYIKTRGFGAGDAEAMHSWITSWQGARNLYFQVNVDSRPVGEIDRKGRKEHITSVIALHLDIDAYKEDSEDREAGRERVLRSLTEALPDGIPGPPSVINLSGNGYNCFWRLRAPVIVAGDPAAAEEVERRNRALALAFGGDMTTDISRIMRLPWTANIPDQRKRDRGLKPVLARVVSFDSSLRYDFDDFPAATATGGAAARGRSNPGTLAADRPIGAAVGVESLHELKDVPLRTKVIIQFGHHPHEIKPSRSEWLWSAILSMLRAGVSDEVVLGVITDPRWAISESVLEKTDPQDYARYQIGRARARLAEERTFDDN